MMHIPLAFGFSPGPMEMLIIAAIAVLLFGKRLPEVGRSLGKGIVEFKKGVRGIEDDVDTASSASSSSSSPGYGSEGAVDDSQEATAPKFEPPSEPQAEM